MIHWVKLKRTVGCNFSLGSLYGFLFYLSVFLSLPCQEGITSQGKYREEKLKQKESKTNQIKNICTYDLQAK